MASVYRVTFGNEQIEVTWIMRDAGVKEAGRWHAPFGPEDECYGLVETFGQSDDVPLNMRENGITFCHIKLVHIPEVKPLDMNHSNYGEDLLD